MRFAIPALGFAVTAAAFVMPNPAIFGQLSLDKESAHDKASWLDWLPSKSSAVPSCHDIVDTISSGIEHAVNDIGSELELDDIFEGEEGEFGATDGDEAADRPRRGHRGRHGRHDPHHQSNLTIYQLVSKSKFTTKFAKALDEYDDLVKLLNSTKANYTLFVPLDSAIKDPPGDKKPSKDFIESVLRYHIGLGLYPAFRILGAHTVPTALSESLLGDEPQRLRTSFGLGGVRLNLYSKVVAANLRAKNGIIHAVNHPLIPPPVVGKELSLFPTAFSTLLLAYDKTEFVKFVHGLTMNGTTVFAPTNGAFARLGPAANAFLFNTKTGLKYLDALLKYQIVANVTLYSDASYGELGSGIGPHPGKTHVDLPTLLDDAPIGVDIFRARFKGFVRMRVNRRVPVVILDGVAKNGVVHVVGRVPLPPRKGHKDDAEGLDSGAMDVDDLKERLADYVEDDSRQQSFNEDL